MRFPSCATSLILLMRREMACDVSGGRQDAAGGRVLSFLEHTPRRDAAPWVGQWAELWRGGAISLERSSAWGSKNSMASTPTYFRDSRTRRDAFSAARWMGGSRRGAGARESRRIPSRWWFSTSG